MSIDTLVAHLDGVRETGHGKYIARCPAHDDRSPSLAVRHCGDGRVLLHCFAGCETEDVLAAVGLTFSDIMPERTGDKHSYKPLYKPFSAQDALATRDHESLVIAVIAADILEHKEVDDDTWGRLGVAVQRINSTRAMCAPARMRP